MKTNSKDVSTNRGSMTIIIGIIVLLLILAGAYFFTQEAEAPENGIDNGTATTTDSTATPVVDEDVTTGQATSDNTNPAADDSDSMVDGDGTTEDVTVVTYTKDGFSPKDVSISVGDTVRFENESGPGMWVASAQHPTHTVYPGSDIKKCGTAGQSLIFDACGNSPAGAHWDFTFTEKGEWGYHNHSRASHFGKVVVQ